MVHQLLNTCGFLVGTMYMALLPLLSVLILAAAYSERGFMPSRPCTIKECRGYEWKNDWTPNNIPTGECVKQTRPGHPLYTSKTISSLYCPPSIPCFPHFQQRTKCEFKQIVISRHCVLSVTITPLISNVFISSAIQYGTCTKKRVAVKPCNVYIPYLNLIRQ